MHQSMLFKLAIQTAWRSAVSLPGCNAQAERIAALEAKLDAERQDKMVTESARAAAVKVLYCTWGS